MSTISKHNFTNLETLAQEAWFVDLVTKCLVDQNSDPDVKLEVLNIIPLTPETAGGLFYYTQQVVSMAAAMYQDGKPLGDEQRCFSYCLDVTVKETELFEGGDIDIQINAEPKYSILIDLNHVYDIPDFVDNIRVVYHAMSDSYECHVLEQYTVPREQYQYMG